MMYQCTECGDFFENEWEHEQHYFHRNVHETLRKDNISRKNIGSKLFSESDRLSLGFSMLSGNYED